MTENDFLIERIVESAKDNPRMARGLRELIKKAMNEQPEGSDERSHLLETLNILDNYIAEAGEGYSEEPVMGNSK